MDQIGFISEIDGNTAEVIVRRTSSCGDKCGSCKGGCSVSGVNVKMTNKIYAKKGDFVEVRMKTETVLKSAFLVYMIPLILMIIGISGGIYLFNTLGFSNYETLGFLNGLVFLGISYLILRVIDNKIKKNNSISFEMVRVVDFKN